MTKAEQTIQTAMDLGKISDEELEILQTQITSEQRDRALTTIRKALARLDVQNIDAVMDAIMETMELPQALG